MVCKAQREAGRGGKPGVNYGSKVTEIKKYCESVSGRFYSDKPLAPFLQNDRKVLRFYCMWDATNSLHGIRHKYIIHFFLSDDTAEVRERYAANCGSDPWPMLIKRGKLPKNFVQATRFPRPSAKRHHVRTLCHIHVPLTSEPWSVASGHERWAAEHAAAS